ncbi:hypothetical protein NQ315_002685 [Exocentrus adspersus]|uniref:Transposase n=1 Tax=Exocentrus adspersus TaxID=1586481 RepID=A0AAV8VHX6_9CUCU|nr:hypothetical protein NQ315_002685 [Exocentrus adspersus]
MATISAIPGVLQAKARLQATFYRTFCLSRKTRETERLYKNVIPSSPKMFKWLFITALRLTDKQFKSSSISLIKIPRGRKEVARRVCQLFSKGQNIMKENSGPLLSVNEVDGRVAEALQVSLRTVSRICGERQRGIPLETPGQKRNKPKKKSEDLPDGIKTSVRNIIYDMKQNGKHVTIKTINKELKRKEIVHISNASLGRLLKTIGFKYKMENHRRYLCELSHVAYQRVNFLRQYYNNLTSKNPLQCVYLDETWIYSKGSFKRTLQDNSIKSCRKGHEGTGKRFIVFHAGTKHGFVENASLVFSSTSKSADYHDSMNREMFEKWMTEKLLPNLEEPSLIIMDNAPYHSALAEKLPTT